MQELILEIKDEGYLFSNSVIGSYSIGLSTMYRQPNGIVHKWLRLSNYESDKPTVEAGYLKITAFIVGPGQKAPIIEDGGLGADEGDPMQEMIDNGASPAAVLEAQKATQGLSIIDKPVLYPVEYQLSVKVLKGENICPTKKLNI